ncbi:MAG: RNA polymerase sigma factor [Thermoguttaceae bacterium]
MSHASHPPDDEQLWAQWVAAHGPAIRGYLLAMVRSPEIADELAQDVFCRAWEARGRYREEGAARAYLLRIADRLAVDRARRPAREVHLDDPAWRRVEPACPASPPSDGLARREARDQLAAALDELSTPQRRVLLLRYYGNLSFAEIAELMRYPLGTVLSHCHRGLLALRKRLVRVDL